MAILTVGIDLAKNVFALHGVNEAGKVELVRPAVLRDKLHELIDALPPCLIDMEACSGAHHWARLLQASSHTVRLIVPKFVTPYRMTGKRGKNDAADAAAIGEAIQRPHMRFVPTKDVEQQSRLMVHRARQGFVEQRTATLYRIRGLLSEFGIVLPLKAATERRCACECREGLPGYANTVIGDLLSEVTRLDERVAQYDGYILAMARDDARAKQLMQLSGVGPTTAIRIEHQRGATAVAMTWPSSAASECAAWMREMLLGTMPRMLGMRGPSSVQPQGPAQGPRDCTASSQD